MPVTKDARMRHEIIDECLRNRQNKWTRTKLQEKVNEKLSAHYGSDETISLSQIRYDMQAMEENYGAPIEKKQEGNTVIYYYEDPNFSITKLPLENDDVMKLQEVVHIMQQIKGFMIADDIAEIVQRLENRIKFSSDHKKPVIGFENPPEVLGCELLGDIYNAIIRKNVLKISYKHFRTTESIEQIIHPYFLKEYNNRWFLFGWSDKNSRVENMALDRMETVKVANYDYKENDSFDPNVFFENIIGVTNLAGANIENIELLFSKERAPYVLTKKLHKSQEIKKYSNGTMLVKLSLIINKELKSIILGFGNDVEVKKPEPLRLEIKELLEKTITQY